MRNKAKPQQQGRQPVTLRVADVLGRKIVTSDGKPIGRVLDIQMARGPGSTYHVTTLLSGRYGLLHRLHILHAFRKIFSIHPSIETFSWERVERVERSRIVLNIDHETWQRASKEHGPP